MKYINTRVVFLEVPDRTTLAINISGCPIRCPACHSKWLWEDKGTVLDEKEISRLIQANEGINCVAFMGGDAETAKIRDYSTFIKENYPDIQTCWYSGRNAEEMPVMDEGGLLRNLDYVKFGPFDPNKGGLSSKTTNQVMFRLEHAGNTFRATDITYKFRQDG